MADTLRELQVDDHRPMSLGEGTILGTQNDNEQILEANDGEQ